MFNREEVKDAVEKTRYCKESLISDIEAYKREIEIMNSNLNEHVDLLLKGVWLDASVGLVF